jgi:catechol 2,3-dioxygenase-like lactoylglutathione lyase family enzyme
MVDMRLEVVILPVADVDRARAFYEQAGFHLDVDHQPNDQFRVVQFTPPGSDCSVTFGIGLGEVPASPLKGIHLCVSDIEEAVAELSDRGIETHTIRHMGAEGWVDGVDPERRKYGSYSGFTDPDGNGWILQEVGGGTTRTARHQNDS